ncbi:MAG: hypothetical protein ABIR24_13235 [Verrucomicrobiota bacterium]
MIAPDDFALQTGDSLILNLDDEVLTFAPTNSPSFNGRKRYVTTFYPVESDVVIKLAKAMETRVRIKGLNATIDKRLAVRNTMLFLDFAEKCSLIPVIEPDKTGG